MNHGTKESNKITREIVIEVRPSRGTHSSFDLASRESPVPSTENRKPAIPRDAQPSLSSEGRESNSEVAGNLPIRPAEDSSSHLAFVGHQKNLTEAGSRSQTRGREGEIEREREKETERGRERTEKCSRSERDGSSERGRGERSRVEGEKRNRAGCRGVAMRVYQSGSSGFWLAPGRREA